LKQEDNSFTRYWIISFDGTCSRSGRGVGIVLKSPDKVIYPCVIKLEFPCTNNEAEYESLIQGMIISLEMNIEQLIMIDDYELVINQFIQRYKIKKEKLKLYIKRVNELMEAFYSFNTSFVPREKNQKADSLALVASLSNPKDIQRKSLFQVKIISRPSVLDNQEYLQVFENDEELNDFLAIENDHKENDNSVAPIPKVCVKSESLFKRND